ncbi:MAG: NAD kinase [Gammaproteobacteria bacterium TMED95]|jgi:NAD+ kinase|nr:NAD(+) kinase [Gammaproteobacteria bacterium]OUV22415.1 MAG: NAD kinase [Gammaproteobacteria bacterium TMED95]|tara:strand:- start:420 stop:1298 length:879 start_codon:yes stop_codon:yes gene_type:complete
MSAFQRVGIFASISGPLVVESMQRVVAVLEARSIEVMVEESLAASQAAPQVLQRSREAICQQADLVIAIGGDGSMLSAARDVAPFGVPLLGINRGRLGFLADVAPEAIEAELNAVLSGDSDSVAHFLLQGRFDEGDSAAEATALNEVTIHSATMARMIEFDLYIDDVFVYTQSSDGLIVSSPTGSTAYALSAGGPIMHPSLNAIALVPMFPHSLNSRPLVVPGDSELRITLGEKLGAEAKVSFDSQLEFRLHPGESVRVKKHPKPLALIHPTGQNFYGVCRSKLGWASRKID